MHAPVYVFDPTHTDELSRVRGIGRYMQVWRENAPPEWKFVSSLEGIPPHAFFIQPFFTFFQKPVVTRRITDRQIAVIHDLIPQKYPQQFPVGLRGTLFEFWSRWILSSHFDHIITDSEASKRDIVSFLNRKPGEVSVMYPTLARSFWHQPIQSDQQAGSYCIYVGDGTWNKNLVTLAKAIQQADVTCMFVGKVFENATESSYSDPWQKELGEFFKIAQLDKRFIFTGYVTDTQLNKLYQQARVNLLLSRDEGFGFSYVEAASLGCPSVLADTPIFHEIAGETALFADMNQPDEIAERIKKIFLDDALRESVRNTARERVQTTFGVESFQKKLVATIYETGYGAKK